MTCSESHKSFICEVTLVPFVHISAAMESCTEEQQREEVKVEESEEKTHNDLKGTPLTSFRV